MPLEKTLISQDVEDTTLLVYKADGQAVMKGKLSLEQREEVWNYVCCGPQGFWLNRFLDFALIKNPAAFLGL